MIITNQLTASQTAHVAALEAVCQKYDSLQGNIFLSDELNFDSEFPCFYLLYNPDDDEELIGFLSVFAPSEMEAEIYAYTAPTWRRQGCFNTLLEAALLNLSHYGIQDILFVHEPDTVSARAVLDELDAVYRHSEYLMRYEPSSCAASPATPPSPSYSGTPPVCHSAAPMKLSLLSADSSDIPTITNLHVQAFACDIDSSYELICEVFADSYCHARKLVGSTSDAALSDTNNSLLGICFYTVTRAEISIFGVAIAPEHQRKGYASLMLQILLRDLSATHPGLPITLHVSSANQAAFALYQKLGFCISMQFDYAYADCQELLDLF